MTGSGLGGLAVLNALFLLAGTGVMWGIGGWIDWGDLFAMSGVAYLVGLACSTVLTTLVLVFGGGASTAEILTVTLGLAAAGVALGAVRRLPRPRAAGMRRPRKPADVLALALFTATAVLLAEFFREARIQPLTDWDGWSFWIPKAKAIYFFGGIGAPLFRTLDAPSYPLFLPALDAMAFRFMGAPDTTLLGVQFCLLLGGFVVAIAGLLRSLVPQWLVWLFSLTIVVTPQVDHRLLTRIADLPLDMFFCLAALALIRWILTDERWALAVLGIMFAATLATKREGQLLAAVLVVGGITALGWRRRRSWLPVVGTALAAYAVNVPWRLWWMSRHLSADTPEGGILHATLHLSRIPGSFRLVLSLVFNFDDWYAAVPIALAAALVLVTTANRQVAVYFLVGACLSIVGWAWVNWSDPTLPLSTRDAVNPTDRAVGSVALLSLVMTPLMLARILGSRTRPQDSEAEDPGPRSYNPERADARPRSAPKAYSPPETRQTSRSGD